GLGVVFHAQVAQAIAAMQAWGSAAALSLVVVLAAWLAWRAGRKLLAGKLLEALRARPELLSALGASLRLLPRRRSLGALMARVLRRAAHRGVGQPRVEPR